MIVPPPQTYRIADGDMIIENARPRVLHVCDALLNPSETFIQQRLLARRFEAVAMAWRRVENGLDVWCRVVLVPHRSYDGVSYWLGEKLGSFAERASGKLSVFRLLRSTKPAVVHAHFGPVALRIDRECRLLGVPLVVSFYGYDAGSAQRDPAIRRGYARLFASVAAVTAEGPVLARRLMDLGARPETVKLLPLSLPPWGTLPPVRTVPPDDATLRLLQVARFAEKKGVDTTLRAVAAARDAGVRVRVMLAGDGPLRRELEALASELRLGEAVEFAGFVSHDALPHLFGSVHALIQPSRTASDGDTEGGAPTVLIEAQAHGLPVFATIHADIPNVVRHGRTALLSPESDAAALAQNIVCAARDRDLLRRLGDEARRFALRRHDPERLLGLRERVYREAIRRHRLRTRRASGPTDRIA